MTKVTNTIKDQIRADLEAQRRDQTEFQATVTQNMTTITETLNALLQARNQQGQQHANQAQRGNQQRGRNPPPAQHEEELASGQGLDFEDGQPPMDEFLNIRVDDNLLLAQQPHLGANANFELKPALY